MKNKSLIEKIKNRKLTKLELKKIYSDILTHMKSKKCSTIENYSGAYATVLEACFEHYGDVFDKKEFEKYQIEQVREIVQKIKEEFDKSTCDNIKPEIAKLLINYLKPNDQSSSNDDFVVKIFSKEA